MNGGIEAVGDIARGALLARTFEPQAGEGPGDTAEHGLCLNCGTALIGDFCHACGQPERIRRTLSSIIHDLLNGLFNFEGKIWRTVPMLVLHPGALTRRYVAGERARFVSPLALFLFSVFLLFATIHTFDGDIGPLDKSPAKRAERVAALDKQIVKATSELKSLQARRARHDPGVDDDSLTTAETVVSSLKTARDTIAGSEDGRVSSKFADLKTGWTALDKGIAKANANPGLALYKLQESASQYSWALIPISVPFVALLFLWRRQYKLYDHTIFVTYSLSFVMLMIAALSVAAIIGVSEGWILLAVFFAPPIHMFAQLRGAYLLRKRSALWRTVALMMFALFALIAWFSLLLVLGLTG